VPEYNIIFGSECQTKNEIFLYDSFESEIHLYSASGSPL
jgi:hypothetical protein